MLHSGLLYIPIKIKVKEKRWNYGHARQVPNFVLLYKKKSFILVRKQIFISFVKSAILGQKLLGNQYGTKPQFFFTP
jgi:hypothetical protein